MPIVHRISFSVLHKISFSVVVAMVTEIVKMLHL